MNSPSLILQGQHLEGRQLQRFAEEKLSGLHTPSWEKEIFRFIVDWLDDSDSIVQYSSGTTGKSKKLRLLKTSMIRSAEHTCRYFNLFAGQVAALCLPMDYIAGKMMVVRSMVAGLALKIAEPKGNPDLSGIGPVDFCAMVPLQVLNLLKNSGQLPVKKLLIGGAEITPELVSRVNVMPAEVFASYGMAETCSHVALRRLNGSSRQEAYFALPEVSLTLDERGCLIVDASYLPHKIVTNDLVRFTGPDSFIWMGRHDNLINSGGIKVVPEEVEALVLEKMGLECTVLGSPDEKLGQQLVFFVEQHKMPFSAALLETELKKILPRYWQPGEIRTIASFPRNKGFKVDRKKLSALLK
jgi:O-succinylbenzoic acid--CoA ligase